MFFHNPVGTFFVDGDSIDEILSMERGSNRYFYHYDGLGSVTEITDSTGAVAENYTYDAYGNPSVTTSTIGNPYRFTGREFDEESEIYHYRARAYDSTIGRFLQRDPMDYADSMNLFQYTLNNPINNIDPYGELTIPGIGWVDVGENQGQRSLNYWANQYANSNTWYEKFAYGTTGAFSALWTPCTSDKTATTLATGYGAGKVAQALKGLKLGQFSDWFRTGKTLVPPKVVGKGATEAVETWGIKGGGTNPVSGFKLPFHYHIHKFNWYKPWSWFKYTPMK